MPTWPGLYNQRSASIVQGGVVNTAGACATDVACNASANVKGAWATMITALDRPTSGIWVQLQKSTSDDFDYLCDIGIGLAGFETVVIPNMLFSAGPNLVDAGCTINNYYFPLNIPAGMRVAARAQCSATASRVIRVRVFAVFGSWYDQMLSQVIDYGTNTGDSGATSVAPGTSATPAWSELTPGTSREMKGFVIAFGKQAVAGGVVGRLCRCEIGAGPNSAEVVIATYFMQFVGGLGGNPEPATSPFLPIKVPTNTRLTARIRVPSSVSDLYDVALYGVS